MSADRRKQILVGFGALAVVLVVVIAVLRPSFRSEEAAGAIGAVQKHHAPQIAKQDVVLGNEQVKRDQRILFSGYVADAKDLKSFNLGTRAARAESMARLSAKEQELGVRFNEDLTYALGMARSLANDEALNLGSRREQILGLLVVIANKAPAASRNVEDRAALAMKLNEVAEALGSARVDMAHLEMASLAEANQSLDAISRAELQMRLHAATESLGVMAKESAMIQSASLQAVNLNDMDAAALNVRFNDFAASLEQRAQANAREELKMASEEVAALGRMSESLSRMESAANVADTAQLEAARQNLNARFTGVRDNVNAITNLASDTEFASVLGNDDSFSMQVRALSDEVMDLGSRTRAVRVRETPSERTHAVRRH